MLRSLGFSLQPQEELRLNGGGESRRLQDEKISNFRHVFSFGGRGLWPAIGPPYLVKCRLGI